MMARDLGVILTLNNAAAAGPLQVFPTPQPTGERIKGIKLLVFLTASSGVTPSLQVTLQGYDSASKQYTTQLASVVYSTLNTMLELTNYPGIPAVANVTVNDVLPALWNVAYTIVGNITATIGAQLFE